jgi:hypothetical protein
VHFCVTEGILQDFTVAKPSFDLSSDHSPILITLTAEALNQEKEPILSNRHKIGTTLEASLNIPFKTGEDIEAAAKSFNSQVGKQRRNIKGHSRHTAALQ